MKTTLDAVNEFKGEWPNCYVNQSTHHDKECYVIAYEDDNFRVDDLVSDKFIVSTYKKFKAEVTSLSRFAGEELFKEYLAADKTPLEKQVDYTSEEFWKDAPEWATAYATPKGMQNKTKYWIGEKNYQSLNINGVKNTYGKEYIWTRDSFSILALRPQPKPVKPVFTKAMADNGELPSVGMECEALIYANTGGGRWVAGVFKDRSFSPNGGYYYLFDCEGCSHSIGAASHFREIDTRTSKEKAIDDIKKILDCDKFMAENLFHSLDEIHGVTFKGEE